MTFGPNDFAVLVGFVFFGLAVAITYRDETHWYRWVRRLFRRGAKS